MQCDMDGLPGGERWEHRSNLHSCETYREPRRGNGDALSTEDVVSDTPDGELRMTLVKAQGVGLVDLAILTHVDNADHQDMAIAEQCAARIPAPAYAIDDETAIKVTDCNIEVVSEGRRSLFAPDTASSAAR
jgi:dipeptidase E